MYVGSKNGVIPHTLPILARALKGFVRLRPRCGGDYVGFRERCEKLWAFQHIKSEPGKAPQPKPPANSLTRVYAIRTLPRLALPFDSLRSLRVMLADFLPNFLKSLHMARRCIKTGKQTVMGNTRSHSQRHTRRSFRANIQKKRVWDPGTGEYKTIKVAASYLRTLSKRLREGKAI